MKSLQNRLLNEGFYKNMGGVIQPTTKEELQYEIKIKLDKGQTNLNYIDTSEITDMSFLFKDFRLYNLSKLDISKWDVSKVTDTRFMFSRCESFNSDLSKWDVSSVKDMEGMFANCTKFNSDLSKWDVSKVEYMQDIFYGCTSKSFQIPNWAKGRV